MPPTTPRRRLAAALALLALALGLAAAPPAAAGRPPGGDLPALRIGETFVAGISSGGYMATQLQVAHSSRIAGAGVVSAGPYWCALGNVAVALQSCTADTVPRDLATLHAVTADFERRGLIDPTANLATSRTWFFHGTEDPTVLRPVADDLAAWYRHYGVPLTYRDTVAAGHGWISPDGPVPCGATAPPYVNDCSPYDAQADMLGVLLGGVKAPSAAAAKGSLTTFSQDPYAVPARPGLGDPTRPGAAGIGMGETGHLYTPPACAAGAECDLLVVLHGCQQTAEQIGTTFVDTSGLRPWADANRLVLLHPQARPDPLLGNPKGCWDWWGYLGPADVDLHATKRGPQVATVMAMVDALGG